MDENQGWTPPSENEKVEAWRLHELLRAGYPLELAERIASSPANLHIATGLLANGCDPELAYRILF